MNKNGENNIINNNDENNITNNDDENNIINNIDENHNGENKTIMIMKIIMMEIIKEH